MDRERLENGLKIRIVALEEPYCWGPQRLQGRSGTLKAMGAWDRGNEQMLQKF